MRYQTILEFIQGAKKPVVVMDIKTAGFTNVRTELRSLERKGLIKKTENFAKNTSKIYINDDNKHYKYDGTRFYTYQVA